MLQGPTLCRPGAIHRMEETVMTRRRVLVALVLAFCCAAPLGAQAGRNAAIRGIVTNAEGRPLRGAMIVRFGTADTARADSSGRYAIERIALGRHIFTVRHAGYQPVEMEVTFTNDTTLNVDIPLEPARTVSAAKLERVGFTARRAQLGGGTDATFLGPDEIAAKGAPRTSNLLEGVRDLTLRMAGTVNVPYGFDGRCVMTVWLEGRKIDDVFAGTSSGGRNASMRSTAALGLDNLVQVGDIAAIEIYPRPSRTPPQFQSSTRIQGGCRSMDTRTADCGAIVIWTTQE
jgi:hypothetical protein